MSGWHREHPELVGTDADPWMIHESYRKTVPPQPEPLDEGFCFECGGVTDYRTGDVFCCHQCRIGFREDES